MALFQRAANSQKFQVFVAGQKRRVTPAIKRQMKRRAAVGPVIGHLKDGHRMGRNFLAHSQGDAINPILAAVGYNFRLILKWIRLLCLQNRVDQVVSRIFRTLRFDGFF